MQKLGDLTNDVLLARLSAHVGKGHVWQARLLEYLGEVEVRKLDREYAYSSMWDFCLRKLGMSEGEAHRRIAVARVVRQFPRALALLECGKVHLSAVYALRDHLTEENHEELLREAIGKSTQEVRVVIAARFPRPDAPVCIEPIAPQAPLPVVHAHASEGIASSAAGSVGAEMRPTIEPLSATRYRVELTVSAHVKARLERIKDLMRHRNPSGDLEVILDASLDLLLAKLERERLGKVSCPKKAKGAEAKTPAAERADATTHAGERADATTHAGDHVAAGPPDRRVDAAVTPADNRGAPDADGIAITNSFAASSPAGGSAVRAGTTATTNEAATPGHPSRAKQRGAATTEAARRRHIPREVRRQVFERDGEQCSYVDTEGNRCPARAFLELDHVHPKGLGGTDDAANLRVRCRAHNQLYAEQVYGRQHVAARIHLRQNKYGAPPSPRFATAAQALRSLGFTPPEVRRAMSTLETRLGEETPIERILREALLLLT